jgi:lipopolysaccharide biosynthesis glycosyltransferase
MSMETGAGYHAPHVVMSCDAAYVDGLAGALSAVARNLRGRELTVSVLDSGIDDGSWGRLEGVFAKRHPWLVLRRVRVEGERLDRFCSPLNRKLSRATYARLLLPELLPEVSRVLYMDCDILTDTDLTPLFAVDLKGRWAGAVRDAAFPFLVDHVPDGWMPEGADVRTTPAFNAGFMVMDLNAWRREGVAERAAGCAARVQGKFQDQAILNHVLCGRWQELPTRWNRQFFVTENFSVYREWPESVWHFVSETKAWNFTSEDARGVFRDFQREWADCGWTPGPPKKRMRPKSAAWRDGVKAARAAVLRAARRFAGGVFSG